MTTRGSGRPPKYLLADGTPVPGVTTVCGRFKESGALLAWAFGVGKSGAASLYEQRDKAADVGSIVHSMVEAHIHGELLPPVPDQYWQQVDSAFGAFRKWFDGSNLRIIATETPYVSERYRYGGTLDAIALDTAGDQVCLLDWKTSNGIYTDYLLQLAAYQQLWNEHNPDRPITGGFHLCRFSKEHGDFSHHYWPDLSDALEMFLLLVRAYELDKGLKKRAK